MSLIPSLYIPPNPNVYLESISPLLASARPPLLHGTVGVPNIAYEKHVGARFTIDGWTTVFKGLAQYTGPTISGTHHHGDGDDGKWAVRVLHFPRVSCAAPCRTLIDLMHSRSFGCVLHRAGVREWWD